MVRRAVLTLMGMTLFFTSVFTGLAQDKPALAVLDVFGKGVEKAKLDIVYNYIIDKTNRAQVFSITERALLDKAMKEIEFSNSALADEKTASRLGQISGARYILISSLTKEEGIFYLAMRVVETETAKIRNTSIKNTDKFLNVEALTEEAIKSLLDIDTAPSSVQTSPRKLLGGSNYFFDDRSSGGNSQVTNGNANNNRIIMEGNISQKIPWGYIGTGINLNAESIKSLTKARGIKFKVTGDNNYYMLKVRTAKVKDNDNHYIPFFAPSGETEINIIFNNLHQWGFGQKIAFDNNDIIGLEILTFDQPLTPIHIEAWDLEPISNAAQVSQDNSRKITGAQYLATDKDTGGSSELTKEFKYEIIGYEGSLTNQIKNAYALTCLNFSEESLKTLKKAKGIRFRAKGNGKEYYLEANTPNVKDYCWYTKIFRPDKSWQEFVVLFKDLKQGNWGQQVDFDKNKISGLSFTAKSPPYGPVALEIADLEFILE